MSPRPVLLLVALLGVSTVLAQTSPPAGSPRLAARRWTFTRLCASRQAWHGCSSARRCRWYPAFVPHAATDRDGRPVAVTGDDFTVRGGSADASDFGTPTFSNGVTYNPATGTVTVVSLP